MGWILLVSIIVSVMYGGWWWVSTVVAGLLWIAQSTPQTFVEREPSKEELQIRELVRSRFGESATYEFHQDGVLVEYDSPQGDKGLNRKREAVPWIWFMSRGVNLPFGYTKSEAEDCRTDKQG